jgi:hypothetical protein
MTQHLHIEFYGNLEDKHSVSPIMSKTFQDVSIPYKCSFPVSFPYDKLI